MIEEIYVKNTEVLALLTMISDEVTGIYAQKTEFPRLYELDRLKNTLPTALLILTERVQEIDKTVKKAMESERRIENGDSI